MTHDEFEKLNDKVDELVNTSHKQHLELLEKLEQHNRIATDRLHQVDLKIKEFDGHFAFMTKLFGAGGVFSAALVIKELFFHQ